MRPSATLTWPSQEALAQRSKRRWLNGQNGLNRTWPSQERPSCCASSASIPHADSSWYAPSTDSSRGFTAAISCSTAPT
jgi:hypothetical protein